MREQIRLVFISTLSMVLSIYTDLRQFLIALVVAFGFNIWAGMRADGISVVRCVDFSWNKFFKALKEFVTYCLLILVIKEIMFGLGDKDMGVVVMKTVTYIFCYVYIQNGLKNCIKCYPKNKGLRIIYHIIRLEFTRALPQNVKDIIERIERNEDKEEYK